MPSSTRWPDGAGQGEGASERGSTPRAARVRVVLQSLSLLFFYGLWWSHHRESFEALTASAGPAAPVALSALFATLGHVLGHLFETTWYRSFWRMRGITLSYSRLWFEIVSISSCDLFAFWLRKLPAAAGDPLWIRLVAGREPEPAADALEATLVSTGLMVLLRLLGTAAAQCHGNHSRFTEALALTLGTWIAWKGAFVLLMSLLRGSMMP